MGQHVKERSLLDSYCLVLPKISVLEVLAPTTNGQARQRLGDPYSIDSGTDDHEIVRRPRWDEQNCVWLNGFIRSVLKRGLVVDLPMIRGKSTLIDPCIQGHVGGYSTLIQFHCDGTCGWYFLLNLSGRIQQEII